MRKLRCTWFLALVLPYSVTYGYDFRLDVFTEAMIQTETDGRARPGDGGRAQGILQIHPITVREANRILKRDHFTYEDRHCENKSKQMLAVCSLFRRDILTKRHGHAPSYARLAETWKAGDTVERVPKYAARFKVKYIKVLMDKVTERKALLNVKTTLTKALQKINTQLQKHSDNPAWLRRARHARSGLVSDIATVDKRLRIIKSTLTSAGSAKVKLDAQFHAAARALLAPGEYKKVLAYADSL